MNGLVDGLMGVTGERADEADGPLMGEWLVGDVTVNEERLSESDDEARLRWFIVSPPGPPFAC